MKKFTQTFLACALTAGSAIPGLAQTSKFEGWSASLGLSYQSVKPKFENVVDTSQDTYTVNASTGAGVVGKVGVEYTWALDSKYVVSAGVDYGLNYGKSSDIDFYDAAGLLAGSDRMKVKQNATVSIAPGMLIDNNTLGYIKFGYLSMTSKSENDGTTESGNAYVYGIGAKFLQPNNYFVYAGLDFLAGKKKSLTGELSGDSKGSGYALSAGIGKRF